jgi:hypothetical protein
MVLLKFFAQRTAIDAEAGSGSRLVVIAVPEHGFEHRLLYFGDHGFKQVTGQFTVEIFQVLSDCTFYGLL